MSEDKCPLCFEELNVPEYRENTTNEPIVEGNTTRLECGHAYHSNCVVQMIRTCNGRCAQCNATQLLDIRDEYASWEQRLTFEGKCKKALAKVKRIPDIAEGIRDAKAFHKEIDEKRKEFNKRVLEVKQKIAEDLKIEETIKLYEYSKRETVKRFKKAAKESGTLELATVSKLSEWKLKEWLFGRQEWYTRRSYTLNYFFRR
jgi:hypothetical protein